MTTAVLPNVLLGTTPKAENNSLDYSKLKDFALAKASGGGDMLAFEELYQRHHRRVYSICLRMIKNPHEAEDLAQDALVQVYRKISSFKGNSAFTTWLHRITVNQVLMHFRKRHVKYEMATENDGILERLDAINTSLHQPPIIDRVSLERAIEQLPEGYRNVLVLHDILGFEHEEIAEKLGCHVGTCKSQLFKARIKMRRILKAKISVETLRAHAKFYKLRIA